MLALKIFVYLLGVSLYLTEESIKININGTFTNLSIWYFLPIVIAYGIVLALPFIGLLFIIYGFYLAYNVIFFSPQIGVLNIALLILWLFTVLTPKPKKIDLNFIPKKNNI